MARRYPLDGVETPIARTEPRRPLPAERRGARGVVPRLALLFLFDGAAIGTFFPFTTVMLAARGFVPVQIGLLTAVMATLFTVALPVWGHIADVNLGRVRAFRVGAVGAIVGLALFLGPWPLGALAAAILLFTAFEAPLATIADALVVNALEDPTRSFPRIRVVFSFAAAAATLVLGVVLDRVGYGAVPFAYIGAALGMIVVVGLVPDVERATHEAAGPGGSIRAAFNAAPRLPLVLLATGLAFFTTTTIANFLSLRLVQLGSSPFDVGLSSALAGFAEIPAALVASRIARRIGLRGLFAVAALLNAIVLLAWTQTDAIAIIVATRTLTGLAFAGLFVALVLTIQATLPQRLQATGQGLFQAVAFGGAGILADLVGGALFGSAGADPLFAMAAVFALLAAGVAWTALPARAPEAEVSLPPVVA